MTIQVLMPALSPTMEVGTLAKWLKKEGDKVESGDMLAEIETDKATMEFEAVDEGILGKILVPEGSEGVKVSTPIALLLEEGEDRSALEGAAVADPQPAQADPVQPAPVQAEPVQNTLVQTGPAQAVPIQIAPVHQALLPPPAAPALEPAPDASWAPIAVRDALRDAMAEEMRRDSSVFVMGEEVAEYQGAYKVTRGLLEEFGSKRVVDTPITEHGFAGLGVGAGFGGLRPIVEFMTMNFAMQALDHIINSAAKTLYMSGGQMGCPIVFRGPNGAAARVAAQHSQDFSSWYAHVPGLKVVAPYDSADAKGLLKSAIRDPNPVVFLENELLYGESFDAPTQEDWLVPLGVAKIRKAGTDVTITAHSRMVGLALEAADRLAEEGVSAEILDLRTLRPLDTDSVVRSVMKTNRLVCVEEGWGVCGIGAEVATRVVAEAFDYLDAPPARVYQEDVPMPYAANLEALSLPDVDRIMKAVKAVLYRD